MSKWHKGSRFWLLGAQALWLSWLLDLGYLLFSNGSLLRQGDARRLGLHIE